ncbi:hypothetical protein Q2T76_01835 [Lactobacillus sp. YT155]|uniref:hypothetical protein n=1 Tax=Lactobacillus sp. YT155 TaxID=3060955 RepID=UPI00265E6F1C|nr:hypothetical protein [Lactobacillus sp. YT155]MDO1604792.1 hypothetical protein [Lactobacillus sp. YT155]
MMKSILNDITNKNEQNEKIREWANKIDQLIENSNDDMVDIISEFRTIREEMQNEEKACEQYANKSDDVLNLIGNYHGAAQEIYKVSGRVTKNNIIESLDDVSSELHWYISQM